MRNSSLAIRTDFSLGESMMNVDSIISLAKEKSLAVVAVADTMSISSMIDLTKKANKEGIEAIVGVRLTVVDDPFLKDKSAKQRVYSPKLFARSEEGMRIIFKLLTLGFGEERFYMTARLGWDDIFDVFDSSKLILTTGDFQSALEHRNIDSFIDYLCQKLPLTSDRESVFFEALPIDLPISDRVNNVALTKGVENHFPTLVTRPVFYVEGQEDMLPAAWSVIRNSRPDALMPAIKDYKYKTLQELAEGCKEAAIRLDKRYGDIDIGEYKLRFKSGLLNIEKFINMCAYRWEKKEVSLPHLSDDPDKTMSEECKKGWVERFQGDPVFGHKPTANDLRTLYMPRLKYELGILKQMNFAPYFLLVQDVVMWAKKNGIMVGPARGSAAGSLVSYLMGITDVDPIRFNLIFERFINPDRNDLPDIDLDFASERREEVIDYITAKYGEEYVAGIVTFTALGSKSALRDVGRVNNIDPKFLSVSKLIPSPHGMPISLEEARQKVGGIADFADKNPELWKQAIALEGNIKAFGRHAAGVVVAGVPLVERAVVERRSGARVINWDKRTSEDMGLIKLDVLGLSTLDVFKITLEEIKKRHGIDINTLHIPIDDQPTLEAFSEGKTLGVFQFEGGSAKRLLQDMAATSTLSFNDIQAANALNRPGPLEAGLVDNYIEARNGYGVNTIEHASMEEALKDTYNVMVYQEQIMKIAVDLAGFTFSEADTLRKAIGKKSLSLMKEMKDKFVDGAYNKHGFPKPSGEDLWDKIEGFAAYSFNASHACAYSLISFQAMWFKVHYPVEFYAGVLSTLKEEKLQAIIKEAGDNGITVMPPDVNYSSRRFEVFNDKTLTAPLNRVKYVSDKATDDILRARADGGKFKDINDFNDRVTKRLVNARVRGSLDKVGAFHSIDPNSLAPNHPSRAKDQMVLMPSLASGFIIPDRDMVRTAESEKQIEEIVNDYRAINVALPQPFFGKNAKFMVISDTATKSDEKEGTFAAGFGFEYFQQALVTSGLRRSDAYFTALVKRTKLTNETIIDSDTVKTFTPFLMREINALKPPIIVTCGSMITSLLVPEITKGFMDFVGRRFYSQELDAVVIVAFNPMQIYHDEDKQDLLDEVFADVASMIM